MAFGYVGKILRVDLSTGKTWIEEPDDKFYRTYVGGRNIIAHYLLKEAPAGADPARIRQTHSFSPPAY